eukprot:jgi/Chrzof1/12395/Cz06g32260.t1
MRNPKKGKGNKKEKRPPQASGAGPSTSGGSNGHVMNIDNTPFQPSVWRPGVDPVAEDEELDYDPTAYDCLHRFTLDWPCLSFDFIRDDLGAPRSAFPHTVYMVAGTQAAQPRQNYLALLKLTHLSQGRHGKKDNKSNKNEESEDESADEDESEDDSMDDDSDADEDKERAT